MTDPPTKGSAVVHCMLINRHRQRLSVQSAGRPQERGPFRDRREPSGPEDRLNVIGTAGSWSKCRSQRCNRQPAPDGGPGTDIRDASELRVTLGRVVAAHITVADPAHRPPTDKISPDRWGSFKTHERLRWGCDALPRSRPRSKPEARAPMLKWLLSLLVLFTIAACLAPEQNAPKGVSDRQRRCSNGVRQRPRNAADLEKAQSGLVVPE